MTLIPARSRGLKPAACHTTGWKAGSTALTPAVRAFTLIELLVVISIILVLLGAVIVAGPKLLDSGRSQTTQLMLVAVRDAVEEFKREQTEKPTLTRPLLPQVLNASPPRNYRDRFGAYPPDELEIFCEKGLKSIWRDATLAPGKAVVRPTPMNNDKYEDMKFFPQVPPGASPEFRDNLALTLAIDLFGQSSKMMLEQVAANHRRDVPPDPSGSPSVYLDVSVNNKFDPAEDRGWYYLVDSWGVPIGYMAQRDYDHRRTSTVLDSSNHRAYWGPASTGMVKRNGGQPVIFSYGPDGTEQVSRAVQTADPRANMVGDWMDGGGVSNNNASQGVIDHPLNRDNVYADPIVKQRLESVP